MKKNKKNFEKKIIYLLISFVLVFTFSFTSIYATTSGPGNTATEETTKKKGTIVHQMGGTIVEKESTADQSGVLRAVGSGGSGKGGGSKTTDANSTSKDGSTSGSKNTGGSATGKTNTTGGATGAPGSDGTSQNNTNIVVSNDAPQGNEDVGLSDNKDTDLNPQQKETKKVNEIETTKENIEEAPTETSKENKKNDDKESEKETKVEDKKDNKTNDTNEADSVLVEESGDGVGEKTEGKANEKEEAKEDKTKLTAIESNNPGGYGGSKKIFELNTAGGLGINDNTMGLSSMYINVFVAGTIALVLGGFAIKMIMFILSMQKFKKKRFYY